MMVGSDPIIASGSARTKVKKAELPDKTNAILVTSDGSKDYGV